MYSALQLNTEAEEVFQFKIFMKDICSALFVSKNQLMNFKYFK